MGFEQLRSTRFEDAARSLELSAKLASDLGARDLSDFSMAAYYAEANAWRVEALMSLGRSDEAKRVAEDAVAVADKVLAQRPGYRLALHAQQLLVGQLAGLSMINLDPLNAVANAKRAVQISLTLLEFDPGNIVTTNNLAVARTGLGDVYWTAGRMREAMPYYDQSVKDALQVTSGGPNLYVTSFYTLAYAALRHAQIGDFAGAGAIIDSGKPYLARLRQSTPGGKHRAGLRRYGESRWPWPPWRSSGTMTRRPDASPATSRENCRTSRSRGAVEEFQKNTLIFWAGLTDGHVRDGAEGLRRRRAIVAGIAGGSPAHRAPHRWTIGAPRRVISTWLAMALARAGQDRRSRQADRARREVRA